MPDAPDGPGPIDETASSKVPMCLGEQSGKIMETGCRFAMGTFRARLQPMNAIKKATISILRGALPPAAKRSLVHLGFHVERSEFDKFAHDYSFAPSMTFGLGELAQRGFQATTIVDVGAFEGAWSRLARRIWPAANLVMVEANRAKEGVLIDLARELKAAFYCELLGAEHGRTVQFHVMDEGSSVMGERSPLARTVEQRQLATLDSLLADMEAPGLLKIDTQGYELEVLRGAVSTLSRFGAVLLEISLIEINEGAPLLHDVIAFMKARSFVAYDVLEIHRRPLDQACNQLDILFVTEDSPLLRDKRHFA